MGGEQDLIELVRQWMASGVEGLTSRVETVQFGQDPEGRDKRAVWLDIESPTRSGRLIVWDTGEAELLVADVILGDVVWQEHRLIHSQRGIADAISEIDSRLFAD